MRVLRTWYLLLGRSWLRLAAGFLFLLALMMFYPAAWTPAERIAAKQGYLAGLAARLADPVLWKRTLIGGFAFVVLQSVFLLFGYYAALVGQRARSGKKGAGG
jgi:hypothetical protein